jgi:hypothetical protein
MKQAVAIIVAALICSATYVYINRYQSVGKVGNFWIYKDMISRKLVVAGPKSVVPGLEGYDIGIWVFKDTVDH